MKTSPRFETNPSPGVRPIPKKAGVSETPAYPSRIVAFREPSDSTIASLLKKAFAINQIVHSGDFQSSLRLSDNTNQADLLVYDNLGIGMLKIDDPEKFQYVSNRIRNSRRFEILREESYLGPIHESSKSESNSSNEVSDTSKAEPPFFRFESDSRQLRTAQFRTKRFEDNRRQSWALQACGITNARWTGRGAKIGILDTGIDFRHRDWESRRFDHRSFIDESAQDFHGHGTQCAGLAGGHSDDREVPRYGAAPQAELHIAKVLENDGSGRDLAILAGIDWAIAQGCQILSLSVGVQSNTIFPDPVYELVGRRCLKSGRLFMAAAGNDSARPGIVRPVARPASCPSIFAVGAVDRNLRLATFTNGSEVMGRGQIDAVAPGVDVFTTSRGSTPYGRFSGTSMAAPLCAGVAALLIQDDESCLGPKLWQKLAIVSRRLPLPSTDVGMGLVSLSHQNKSHTSRRIEKSS